MSEFKVGDKVKVIGGWNTNTLDWVSNMDRYIGGVFEIESVDSDGGFELVGGDGYAFDKAWLEPEPNVETILQEATRIVDGPRRATAPVTTTPGGMQWFAEKLEANFDALRALRGAGQKEYAHDDGNAFANFERVARDLGLKREQILLVYLKKHLDGITAWVNGHKSQRESVLGRIHDAQLYLALLAGMAQQGSE